jgi:hypothetical protein
MTPVLVLLYISFVVGTLGEQEVAAGKQPLPGREKPRRRDFPSKRLMGFEPTTFCMAITGATESRAPRM